MTTIHALYFRARSLALIYALFVALPLVRFARRLRASCHRPRPVRARFAHYGFRRFACLLMVAVMVVQFALFPPEVSQAAVKAVSAKAANYKQDTLFWWNSSGWAARSERFLRENFPNFGSTVQQRNWDGKGAPRLAAPKPQPQETQDARNGRVARVEISPREATIAAGERIHFIAVAYDADNSPVGGVSFDWDKEDEDTGEKMSAQDRGKFSSANGGFSSAKEGNFRVKARFGGFEASAKVKVKGVRHSFGQQPIGTRTVSSSDLPQQSRSSLSPTATKDRIAKNAPGRFRTKYSSAGTMAMPRLLSLLPNEYGWTDNNFWSADDPNKERGEPAGHAPDGGAGSGNFQFSAPVLSLSGRGQNVKLDLIYNSRVWHKANNEMTFNIDDDWPTPGGSISFGKIVGMGSQNGYMIIEPDGTRRPYTCSITFYPVHQEAVCKTTDGSFIDYKVIGDSPANGGAPTSVDVYLPNGTQVFYGNPGNNAVYATLFWDRNGNTVYVSYRNGHGPHINNITDTLGRVVQVYYDSNNLPVAITAPGLNGGTRTLVRITYQWKDLGNLGGNYGFSGLTTKVRSNVIPVIRAIYYPGNNTGYWFGGEDSYSAYGMLAKVIQQRGMVFSGAQLPGDPNQAADPGTITPGLMTRQIVYDYPLVASGLTKEPSYQTTTETWALMDVAPVVTQYFVQENASPRRVEITRPDGVKTVMLSHNATGQWYDGLIFQDESYSPQGALLGRSFVQWDLGDYSSPRPSRVETTDERGQRTGKELSYGPRFNQVSETREYGYGYVFGGANPLLRRTVNQYLNHPDYTDPLPQYPYIWHHIYNLVTLTDVYSGDGARLSRTEYFYDQFKGTDGLMNTPGINSTGYEIGMSPYVNQPNYTIYKLDTRGNVTTVKRYADAAALDESSTVVETMHYDITGNVRKAETSCCTQTTFNYTLSTQYAWPESQISGSPSDTSKQNTTSSAYDFNTGLVNNSTDANGRISNAEYDPNSLRLVRKTSPTLAYNHYIYDDVAMTVKGFAYEAGLSGPNFASRVDKFLDGKGRVIKEVAFGKADAQDVVDMKYDQLGRLSQQTRPYRAGATPQWSTMTYDFLDRPAQTTAPDGSVVTMSYNQPDPPGSSGQPGETTKMTDPWGRERWSRTDALGRMVEVAEPNPGGAGTLSSGALFTTYDYDALDRLVQVNQGIQTRSFRYDSLDRLTHQKMAERAAALNDSGQWVGAGAWSDVFTYDRRSNLTQHFDARGVKTIFKYIDAGGVDDPLNRLLAVQYDKGGSPSHLSVNIPVAPNVSYAYMTTGDKKRVQNVFVDQGMGNETMSYDSEGRLSRVDQTFTGREGYPLRTDHLWDSLGRQLENTYPQQYMAGEIRKKVEPAYDVASRIESLKFGGATYVSEPVYNASSQATSLKIGSQMFENYEYDPKTGMLTNQKVIRGTTETLLDLKYNYTLNNDANNNGPKTGQLTGVTDMKNQARNTAYEYDKLERLVKVKGGVNAFSNPTWFQNYSYDRFGNKNASSQTPTDTVWFDDSLPAGAATGAAGGDSWNWVSSSPAPLSGSVSHISNIAVDTWSPPPFSGNVSHQSGIVEGGHQQYFWGASPRFLVRNGGLLYAHVYLDPENPPRQLMLQWGEDLNGWDHRAYWGENLIGFGTDGTNSRRYIGPLPAAGGWVRLQVPASAVGLEGRLVHAMAFTLYGGRANWDLAGAEGVDIWYEEVCDELMGCYFVPHYESVNDVFMDDSIPAGATPGADGGYGWNWTGAKPRDLVHQHYFDGATNTLNVNAGDVLYTWAWLDPANKPKQAMLQWNDGSWEHRAYWGENKIGWGVDGTASRKYMGGLPAAGGWVKLEVPASAVGLEGRAVKGMAFTLYGGRAAWDKAGKIGTPPPNLVMGLDGFENLTYNAANNQIISQNFEYDAAGNQTKAVIDGAGTVQQYRYDCANRLVQVLDGSGNVLATHAYGAGNQRLMSVEGGVTRYFAWSRGKIIAEYEAWGTNALIWKTSYVYLGGSLLATTSGANGNETRFHHSGRFGTRLVTASDGTVVTEQFTMPFGNMQPFTSIYGGENPYQNPTLSNPSKKRFTSYDRSAVTSLDYAVNRYYSPQQGRFTQVDPIDMDAASLINPQTLNMYAYCGGDPINREDPEGLFWGAIGRFFKAIGRAIASFFFSGGIGSSGPGFRTPPTFPGSLPGITAAARSGLGGFRTPPFVNGFLQTQDNSWSWERFKNWLNGDGWVTDAEAGRARRLKIEAKLKEAHDYLKSHGLTEEYLGTLTFQEQIDLYEAAKRGDSSFTLDDGRIIQIVAPGQPGNPTPTPTPIPPKVLDKLGGLADRANDKVADVIRSRGGTGSNVNEAGHWAQKTMAETAEAAVKGDMLAEKAIKLSKMAPKKGQRRRK